MNSQPSRAIAIGPLSIATILASLSTLLVWGALDWAYVTKPQLRPLIQMIDLPAILITLLVFSGVQLRLTSGCQRHHRLVATALGTALTCLASGLLIGTLGISFHSWIGGNL